jgi:hypothetical protein
VAEIRVRDGEVEVRLSAMEQAGAQRGAVRVPLTAVTAAWIAEDPWPEMRGEHDSDTGTGVPGHLMLGTCQGDFGKDFCAVYQQRPTVIVELQGAEFARLVVTQDDPKAALRELGY